MKSSISYLFSEPAVNRIRDIANELLTRHRKRERTPETAHKVQPELLSALIDAILSEKRLQFRSRLGLSLNFSQEAGRYGGFAEIESTEFKRVVSNLINNAVDAIPSSGTVTLDLSRTRENDRSYVTLAIADTGTGMSEETLSRLRLGQALSIGKEGGNGLGWVHAQKTIKKWGGDLRVHSQKDRGTLVQMLLPECTAPDWFLEELSLSDLKNVVILDEDASVHEIWKDRLSKLNPRTPEIHAFHLSTPKELEDWLAIRADEISDSLFLVDYELLGFHESGLDLIVKWNLQKYSVLVTSRYEDSKIRLRTTHLGMKMIPKVAAGFIPLKF
jgi:hypothetical protein